MKQKLINKGTIQYLKQGSILYGQQGVEIKPVYGSSFLAHRSNLLRYYYRQWRAQHKDADVGESNHWWTELSGRGLIIKGTDSDKFYKDFDDWVKKHYVVNPDWNRSIYKQEDHYLPIQTDPDTGERYISLRNGHYDTPWYSSVAEVGDNLMYQVGRNRTLQEYINETEGPGHTVRKVNGVWRIYLPGNSSAKPQNQAKPEKKENEVEVTFENIGDAPSPNNNAGNNNARNNTETDADDQPNNGVDPNVTDRRELEESIIHKPAVAPQRQNSNYRLIKRTIPVARPSNMPMMNRSDVRYTLNDITTQSPYFTSDTELVNSLAGTPNDNMFKQALMNRLGMDKWDNTTALNRLNFLGIKGHIGGSDRKRLRNLINKGTTSNGEIRKKQGGVLN